MAGNEKVYNINESIWRTNKSCITVFELEDGYRFYYFDSTQTRL
jgi:hypothetical protein